MDFRNSSDDDNLEINLVPLIDVLLVILIFLAATTTFNKQYSLEVDIPKAAFEQSHQAKLNLAITRDGLYVLDGQTISGNSVTELVVALGGINLQPNQSELIIHADSNATHASVVRAMEAATQAGIEKIFFATQQ